MYVQQGYSLEVFDFCFIQLESVERTMCTEYYLNLD